MGLLAAALAVLAATWLLQLLRTRYRPGLRAIPGPPAASFSNLWKLAAVWREDMPGWNARAHERHGPVVRIGPDHVSFSSPAAFHAIHASRQAFAKSDFYAVGAPTYAGAPLENLFSLRDASRHAALKRSIGGLYTKAAVADLEPGVDGCVDALLRQLARRTTDGGDGGKARLDMAVWLHLYSYESLGVVNVSRRLGFLERGADVEGMIASADRIFFLVGLFTQAPFLQWVLGRLRALKPAEEAEPALKFTLAEIEARMQSSSSSSSAPETDMLSRLLDLHAEHPDKVSIREVTAAIFINLTAGHDVLAITLRAIWYHLARHPGVRAKLRAEIKAASGDDHDHDRPLSSSAVPFSKISKLPYLNAVIHETLRIHPNTGTILERRAPPQGVVLDGFRIPGGTTVGVNAWVLHRDSEVYGPDAHVFRPERWLEEGTRSEEERLEMRRCLFSFGAGAHSCIGKNIALMIVSKLVFEFYRRYDAVLAHPERAWKVHGSWVTKQTGIDMIISRL